MTVRRAAAICSLVAVLLYLPALRNGFALDDVQIIERNPVAHSIGAAARSFARPYWPPQDGAGLWRPAVIVSFAADWQLSGGSTAWLHAVNVLLNALVGVLVVLFLARYATGAGALAGGLVFAVHPLHVEAVANLVGRAELLAAAGLLAALLVARAVRARRHEGRVVWPLQLALLACVALALLSKEHAAIAIALLWLDDRARSGEPGRLRLRDYVLVGALTAAWLAARFFIDRGASFATVAAAFLHLGTAGRLSTMLPVVFVVIRLLVWPWDLSHEYRPRVIERLDHPTLLGACGLIVLLALGALALASWRRHRAASLGLLIIGLAWLPTSNLLFPTGIVLSERTLYFATAGLALLVAAAADAAAGKLGSTRSLGLLSLAVVPLALRTWTRIPVWRSTRDLVVDGLLRHPEAYPVHEAAARAYWLLGDRNAALREYEVATELFPLDPYLQARFAGAALNADRLRLALRHALAAERLDSGYTVAQQTLTMILLRLDSGVAALPHARRAFAAHPVSGESASLLAKTWAALGRPDSALAVWPSFLRRGGDPFERWLLGAATYEDLGALDSAAAALDSAAAHVPPVGEGRDRLAAARQWLYTDVLSRHH